MTYRKQSPRLTYEDAIEICKLRLGGMYQHDIAARYGVNQGRISEIVRRKRFPNALLVALTLI